MIKLVVNTRHSNKFETLITATMFNEVEINMKYDSVANTFRFQLFFDPSDYKLSELAAVSHIHECKIYYVHDKPGMYAVSEGQNGSAILGLTNDEPILTGFMLSQSFNHGPEPSFMEVGGYSKPGVLGDCDFPTKAFPLESVGMTFRQIINNKVLPYFKSPASGGFKFYIKSSRADSIFENDINKKTKTNPLGSPMSLQDLIDEFGGVADEVIDKTTAPESKNILSYLKELAVQKDLILSCDAFGNLIINAPYTGDEFLFEIGTGSSKAVKAQRIISSYNGQGMFSDIEVVGQAPKDGGNMPYALIINPFVPIVYRPKVITLSSGTDVDCQKAGMRERSNQLTGASVKIELQKPVVNGRFITPNNTVRIKDPESYLYEPSKWFIEEMNYKLNADGEKTTVTCVPPSVYDRSTPINPYIKRGENSGLT